MYFVLENAVECLDNPCGVPPFGRLDHVGDSSRCRTALRLNLANRTEAAGWERFLELTRYAVVGMVVRLERGEQLLTVFVTLLLG